MALRSDCWETDRFLARYTIGAACCLSVGIALKEMRETYGWLQYIVLAELMPPTEIASLMNEAHQLRRILGKSVGTAQARSDSEFHESGAGEISDFEQFGRNPALPEL